MGAPFGSETIGSLAQRVKQKYPQYAEMEDRELVRRLIGKYPNYQKALSDAGLKELAETASIAEERKTTESPGLLRSTYELGKGFAHLGAAAVTAIPEILIQREAEEQALLSEMRARARGGQPQIGMGEVARRGFRPVEQTALYQMVVEPQLQELEAAKQARERGEYGQFALRGVTAAIPFLGPAAGEMAETARVHGRWEAAKQAAPIIATTLLPGRLARFRARGAQLRAAETVPREPIVPAQPGARVVRGLLPAAEAEVPIAVRAARLPEPTIIPPPPAARLALPAARPTMAEIQAGRFQPAPEGPQPTAAPLTNRQILERAPVQEIQKGQKGAVPGEFLVPVGRWLETAKDIAAGLRDVFRVSQRARQSARVPQPPSLPFDEAASSFGLRLDREVKEIRSQLSKAEEIILERRETIKETGTIQPKEIRPEVAYGKSARGVKVSPALMERISGSLVEAGRELQGLRQLAEKQADPLSINQLRLAEQRFQSLSRQWRQARKAWHQTGMALQREVPDFVLTELGEIGRTAKNNARLPLLLDVKNILREWREGGMTTGKAVQGLAYDLLQYLRINLFAVGSPTLDLFTNSIHAVNATSGYVAGDLYMAATKGDLGFVRTGGLIRAIKEGRGFYRQRPDIEAGLGRTIAGEELSQSRAKFEPLGISRAAGLKGKAAVAGDIIEHALMAPLWGKQLVDMGFGRTFAIAELYSQAFRQANHRGLRGVTRERFIQDFVERSAPEAAIDVAVKEGNRAKFNRQLSKIEEGIARSGWIQAALQAYPRWSFQFTRWLGEQLGVRPELWRRIKNRQASGEEIARYLAETATGWGGVYLVASLYDNVDFNTMEYRREDGSRIRLSGRTPIPEALLLVAMLRGDWEKAQQAAPHTSFPLFQGKEGGILGGIYSAFYDANMGTINPHRLGRELTEVVNRAVPGQGVLRMMNSLFDPTLREGIGSQIPGVAQVVGEPRISTTTGEPLQPMQEFPPGTGVKFPTAGGVPLPGATRLLEPVERVLLDHGIGLFRPRRTPIAEFQAEDVPPELRQEYERIAGRLVNQYIREETSDPSFRKLPFDERREILVKAVGDARADARDELAARKGYPELPKQPTRKERLLPQKVRR